MLAITISTISPVKMVAGCDSDALQEVWRRFNDCTGKYKENYNNASLTLMENIGANMEEQEKKLEEELEEERIKITCQLVDSMVEVCTGMWSSCYPDQEVLDMKQRFVSDLRGKNEKASISIEQCDSIRNME